MNSNHPKAVIDGEKCRAKLKPRGEMKTVGTEFGSASAAKVSIDQSKTIVSSTTIGNYMALLLGLRGSSLNCDIQNADSSGFTTSGSVDMCHHVEARIADITWREAREASSFNNQSENFYDVSRLHIEIHRNGRLIIKMNVLRLLQDNFDRFQYCLNFLWLNDDAPNARQFSERLNVEAKLRNESPSQAAAGYVEKIEGRASGLLQHVSLMIALTGVYFALSEDNIVLMIVLAAEIVGYLWAALCCLRCLLQISTSQWAGFDADAFRQAYELEGLKRELIYRHALQVLVFLTMMLVVIVALHALLLLASSFFAKI